eukprot:5930383-Amphidinium_carterae.1
MTATITQRQSETSAPAQAIATCFNMNAHEKQMGGTIRTVAYHFPQEQVHGHCIRNGRSGKHTYSESLTQTCLSMRALVPCGKTQRGADTSWGWSDSKHGEVDVVYMQVCHVFHTHIDSNMGGLAGTWQRLPQGSSVFHSVPVTTCEDVSRACNVCACFAPWTHSRGFFVKTIVNQRCVLEFRNGRHPHV